MRITLVSDGQMRTPEPNTGGLQRVVYNLGQMLIRRGHLVTLVAAKGSYLEGAVDVVEAWGQVSYTEEKIGEAASATEYDALLDVSHTHVAAYNDPEHSVIFHQDVTPIEKHPRPVFISVLSLSASRSVVVSIKANTALRSYTTDYLIRPLSAPLCPKGHVRYGSTTWPFSWATSSRTRGLIWRYTWRKRLVYPFGSQGLCSTQSMRNASRCCVAARTLHISAL